MPAVVITGSSSFTDKLHSNRTCELLTVTKADRRENRPCTRETDVGPGNFPWRYLMIVANHGWSRTGNPGAGGVGCSRSMPQIGCSHHGGTWARRTAGSAGGTLENLPLILRFRGMRGEQGIGQRSHRVLEDDGGKTAAACGGCLGRAEGGVPGKLFLKHKKSSMETLCAGQGSSSASGRFHSLGGRRQNGSTDACG